MTNRRARVLCIIDTVGLGGGAERLVVSLVPELAKLGIEVEVAALFHWPEDIGSELEARGFRVHRLKLRSPWGIAGAIAKLGSIARTGQFDVIWGNLYFGNLYALLLKTLFPALPVAITLHSPGYLHSPPAGPKQKLRVLIERSLGRYLANARVAVSRAVAEDYEKALRWPKLEVIHNGIATSALPRPLGEEERRAVRSRHGISPEESLGIVPARFVPNKGHASLWEALAELLRVNPESPVRVLAPGVGPLVRELEGSARSLGIDSRIRILDPLPHRELLELISSADWVVLPSLREPFGIAAAEAMGLGKAVILTRVDGFLEIVGETDSAVLVPPGNPTKLAEAISRLSANSALREELGARAKARIAENFEISICAKRWADLFQRLRSPERVSGRNPTPLS